MKFTKTLFCLLFLLSCQHKTPTEPNGGTQLPQWAMYGGNVRHTGNINTPAYDGIVGPTDSSTIQTKWSLLTTNFVGSSGGVMKAPLAADAQGTVYATTSLALLAINPDGSLKWYFAEGGKSSVAIGTDGTVYYHGGTGYLYALALDGSVLWKRRTFTIPDPYPLRQTTMMNIIVIGDNTVVIAGRDSVSFSILALDGRDGSLLWQQFEEAWGTINAAANDGTIYVSQSDKFLAINSSGVTKWFVNTNAPLIGGFANHLSIDGNGAIYKWPEVITADGTILPKSFRARHIALWHDRYYVTTGLSDTLFCHSLTNDELLWRDQPDVQFLSDPTVDREGNVYVIGSGLNRPEFIPGYIFVYNKEGDLINKFIFDLPGQHALRKPFAPVLLPDGSLVFAGYDDFSITCVR